MTRRQSGHRPIEDHDAAPPQRAAPPLLPKDRRARVQAQIKRIRSDPLWREPQHEDRGDTAC